MPLLQPIILSLIGLKVKPKIPIRRVHVTTYTIRYPLSTVRYEIDNRKLILAQTGIANRCPLSSVIRLLSSVVGSPSCVFGLESLPRTRHEKTRHERRVTIHEIRFIACKAKNLSHWPTTPVVTVKMLNPKAKKADFLPNAVFIKETADFL